MISFIQQLKRDPDCAAARKELAAEYRRMRKKSAPVARLVFKRVRAAAHVFAEEVWSQLS